MDIESLILWSDESLLVVNKPSGLRTIPDGYDPSLPYLSAMLQASFGRVWVLHRLDKDTSGVMLFARTAVTHRALNMQFEQRTVQKEYHAIITGIPDWKETLISLPLLVNGDRRHRTVIDHQTGKPADTVVRLLRQAGVFAVITALPHSGYTHQIRAHLAAIGFPILADPLYKSLKPETLVLRTALQTTAQIIQRTALHAFQITLTHPHTDQPLTFQAPYAEDFQLALQLVEKD